MPYVSTMNRAIGGSPQHITLGRTTKPPGYLPISCLKGQPVRVRLSDFSPAWTPLALHFRNAEIFRAAIIVCFIRRLKPDVQTDSETEADDPRNDRIDEQRTGFVLGCSKLDSIHPRPTCRITERMLSAPSARYSSRRLAVDRQKWAGDHDHWVLITHQVPDSSIPASWQGTGVCGCYYINKIK